MSKSNKNGGKKKQEQNTKGSKKQSKATSEEERGSVEKERDLYLIQIRHLSEQLESFQLRCDELGSQNKDLIAQHSALESEKRDVVGYLKHVLFKKEAETAALLEQLEHQQQTASQDRESLELQQSILRQQLQDRIQTLIGENKSLEKRLASLQEFQEQKDKWMSRVECLEKQLSSQTEEYRDDIHSLEIKALMDKRRLQKELESQEAAMKAKVQLLVSQKVPETTKSTLQENEKLKDLLSQLSQHVEVLTKENESLRDDKRQLSCDVDILDQTLSETSRTCCVRKKVVEQLTEKCQKLQAAQREWEQKVHQLQTERSNLSTEIEAIRKEQRSLKQQCSRSQAEERRLQEELCKEKSRRSHMKSNMQEAALILQQAAKEAPSEEDWDLTSLIRWRQLMLSLLADVESRICSCTANE